MKVDGCVNICIWDSNYYHQFNFKLTLFDFIFIYCRLSSLFNTALSLLSQNIFAFYSEREGKRVKEK